MKAKRQFKAEPIETDIAVMPVPRESRTARPTPERLAQGTWATPQGVGKHMQPMVDLASDMIGVLYQTKQINTSQEQAARLFQELRAAYLSELGTKGYGSCLADNQTGYDGGDGNPEVIAAYRKLEDRIGRINTACLILECDRGPTDRPISMRAIKAALNAVGEC